MQLLGNTEDYEWGLHVGMSARDTYLTGQSAGGQQYAPPARQHKVHLADMLVL